MKVIDLLNKIANGEDVPKEICVQGDIFINTDDTQIIFEKLYKYDIRLNNEVEIVSDYKIGHINKIYDLTDFRKEYPIVAEMLKDLSKKQYEIIDKINGEDNE